ncbi:MAG: hypothetical protein K1X86_15485 [Ignavibacteria bacterium]|nr:hypothetical protein [Ignavibacteria bacterium]
MTASFATTDTVRNFGNMPQLSDSKIEPFMNGAKRDVQDIITAAKYEEIYGKGEQEPDFLNLQEAESFLLLKKLIRVINISSEGDGISKATGSGDNRQENLSEQDLDNIASNYDEWAMNILKRYIPAADTDGDGSGDYVRTSGITMIAI